MFKFSLVTKQTKVNELPKMSKFSLVTKQTMIGLFHLNLSMPNCVSLPHWSVEQII